MRHSEDIRLVLFITLGIMVLAVLLLTLTGKYSIFIMLGVCLVVALASSLLGSILLGWGKTNIQANHFFLFLILFFIVPCITAFSFKTGFNHLQNYGLLTPKNTIVSCFILLIIGLYAFRYEKYKWTNHLITEKQNKIHLLSFNISGIKKKHEQSARYFVRRSFIDNHKDLDNKKKQYPNYHPENYYTGFPDQFSINYYSEKEDKVYEGKFYIEKNKVRRLMRFSLLHPLGISQKYDQIHITIRSNGALNLSLGNHKENRTISNFKCTILKEYKLSSNQQEDIKKIRLVNKEEEIKIAKQKQLNNNELLALNQFKPTIIHHVTGLTEKIKSINVVTSNGTKYDLIKENWNEYKTTIYSPPLYICYEVINNKNELIRFEYNYNKRALWELLKNEETKKVNEIKYSFDLFEKHKKLLFANTYEYLNGKKMEFDVHTQLTNLGTVHKD